MTLPINLNKRRKLRNLTEEKARADANAVKFGRTKAQRLLDAAQSHQVAQHLNAHKFDDE
jgi:hypothetical protein